MTWNTLTIVLAWVINIIKIMDTLCTHDNIRAVSICLTVVRAELLSQHSLSSSLDFVCLVSR